MTRPAALVLVLLCLACPAVALAQEEAPRIGPFAVDIRGVFPMFPDDSLQLAKSRGLDLAQLPGTGLGADVGVHVYLLKWKKVTFGVGGEAMIGQAQFTPFVPSTSSTTTPTTPTTPTLAATTERFQTIAGQISLNFGTGHGWSYLSAGVGRSRWSLVAEGKAERPADTDPLQTFNYGGGARWFAKPHLAFTFDVRFWAIDPGAPDGSYPGSPRTSLLVLGAGISLK